MSVYFGGLYLPATAAPHHFAVIGKSGSGKTLTLRMLMGSVLPNLLRTPDQRAILFDVKQDLLSTLSGMGIPEARIVIMNPFDRRCYAWNMAQDCISPETTLQLATILIPEEKGSQNRFFSDAARTLLTGVIDTFNETASGRWQFADLILTFRSPERLRQVLLHTAEGEDLINLYLDGSNASTSVLATAWAYLAPFAVIAATWSRAWQQGRTISLQSFVQQNQFLVLGNNQAATAAIQSINRVMFQRLTELVLDQSESSTRRTWFFLDEAKKLGKLTSLDDLMIAGRSKGAAVVLGMQSIEGWRAEYGEQIADEILSMCGSIGILKVSGVVTPRWASDILGEQEVRQWTRSQSAALSAGSQSSQTLTDTDTETIRERKLFLPSEFQMLPLPQPGQPLYGYFRSDFLESRPYLAQIPPREVAQRLHKKDATYPDFMPWPNVSDKKLQPWTPADYERLGISPAPPPQSGDESKKADEPDDTDGAFRDPYARS